MKKVTILLLSGISLYMISPSGIANAQGLRRWEVGAQFVRLDLDSIGESAGGAGGRVSYNLSRRFAVEAEGNRFFQDSSGNFGHTQVIAGARYGFWFGPIGLFGKVRPGFLHLGGATAARNPGRETNPSLDLGGVIVMGRGRIAARIDAGDALIFWGSKPFDVGIPHAVTKHNRQLSFGLIARF